MSNKPDPKKDEQPPVEAVRNPLILTISEHRALSVVDRENFRTAGGTVTNDPDPTN